MTIHIYDRQQHIHQWWQFSISLSTNGPTYIFAPYCFCLTDLIGQIKPRCSNAHCLLGI